MKLMIKSSSHADLHVPMVADASVMINVIATERAAEIVGALRRRIVVVENVVRELEGGVAAGHDQVGQLHALVQRGLIHRAELGEVGLSLYEQLVSGNAAETLDDGEAATISHAVEVDGVVLIDERKAMRLCRERFGALGVETSVGILLSSEVRAALGAEGQADAVFEALRKARMRVPAERLEEVVAIVGPQRLVYCSSVPPSVRSRGSK